MLFVFFFLPFFFGFAMTLLLSFDELDLAEIEFKAPDHRKTMVHYK